MKQQSLVRLVAAACILYATSAGAMAAQTTRQAQAPARWTQGDSTDQQRLGILKKEIGAAYADQTAACKRGAAAKRDACMKQARATYDHDNANVRQLVADAPQSSVTERVVSVTPAQDTGSQSGTSAYGNSAGGANGAGQRPSGQSMSGAQQPGMSGTATSQSQSMGTGATQSDMQGQSGTAPPVER